MIKIKNNTNILNSSQIVDNQNHENVKMFKRHLKDIRLAPPLVNGNDIWENTIEGEAQTPTPTDGSKCWWDANVNTLASEVWQLFRDTRIHLLGLKDISKDNPLMKTVITKIKIYCTDNQIDTLDKYLNLYTSLKYQDFKTTKDRKLISPLFGQNLASPGDNNYNETRFRTVRMLDFLNVAFKVVFNELNPKNYFPLDVNATLVVSAKIVVSNFTEGSDVYPIDYQKKMLILKPSLNIISQAPQYTLSWIKRSDFKIKAHNNFMIATLSFSPTSQGYRTLYPCDFTVTLTYNTTAGTQNTITAMRIRYPSYNDLKSHSWPIAGGMEFNPDWGTLTKGNVQRKLWFPLGCVLLLGEGNNYVRKFISDSQGQKIVIKEVDVLDERDEKIPLDYVITTPFIMGADGNAATDTADYAIQSYIKNSAAFSNMVLMDTEANIYSVISMAITDLSENVYTSTYIADSLFESESVYVLGNKI